MLIFDPKMFIPFVNGVKLPTFWLSIETSNFSRIFERFLWKKNDNFGRLQLRSFATRKSIIASLSVQPFIVK